MLNLIAAALVAAAPAAPAQPADAHTQHQQMGHELGQMKPGMMAEMKDDCCCKDMMAKMHDGQDRQHKEHNNR